VICLKIFLTAMLLTVDIGNTQVKMTLFDTAGVVCKRRVLVMAKKWSVGDVQRQVGRGFTAVIVSSVAAHDGGLVAVLQQLATVYVMGPKLALPIALDYQTKATLGADRVAAAVGAQTLLRGKNILIIDAGTCIKLDLLTADGVYGGGSISPGLAMRYQALHHFTGRLPLLKASDKFAYPGKSTKASMHAGVVNGCVAEIEMAAQVLRKEYKQLKCVMTGGDGPFFAQRVNLSIFAAPYLVDIGLHEILRYQLSR
jgi:type III pantothenate kinase